MMSILWRIAFVIALIFSIINPTGNIWDARYSLGMAMLFLILSKEYQRNE